MDSCPFWTLENLQVKWNMLPAIIVALMIIVITHYRIKLCITNWAEWYHCQSVVPFSPFRATLCLFLGNIPFFVCQQFKSSLSPSLLSNMFIQKSCLLLPLRVQKSLNLLSTATSYLLSEHNLTHILFLHLLCSPSSVEGYKSPSIGIACPLASPGPRTSASICSVYPTFSPIRVFTLLADKQMQVSLLGIQVWNLIVITGSSTSAYNQSSYLQIRKTSYIHSFV